MNVQDDKTGLEWQITPLFSKPMSIAFGSKECCNQLKKYADDAEWLYDSESSGAVNSGVSENRYILDQDEELKNYFLNLCYSGLGMLGYNTEIQITTSWFTYTGKGGMSREHKHVNSWFSCVFYFDEYDDDTSLISFSTFAEQIRVEPEVFNYLNSGGFKVHPMTGMLLLFPSETVHQVQHGANSKTRHSLAFNIMPKGKSGTEDSTFYY